MTQEKKKRRMNTKESYISRKKKERMSQSASSMKKKALKRIPRSSSCEKILRNFIVSKCFLSIFEWRRATNKTTQAREYLGYQLLQLMSTLSDLWNFIGTGKIAHIKNVSRTGIQKGRTRDILVFSFILIRRFLDLTSRIKRGGSCDS